jgi:hypothetical protein
MNSHTQNEETQKLAANQGSASGLPKRHSYPTLFAILAMLFIATLSISGCVGLTGAGTPAKTTSNNTTAGVLAASATSLNFGNVAPGSKSTQSLSLTNTGTAAVTISQATVFGSGFSVVGAMSSLSIAPGKNLPVQIQFAPLAQGSSNGSLVVSSDASDSSLTLSLSGTAAVGPSITTEPASQSVIAGQTATFDVVATGTGTLTYQWKWNGATINGATSASYTTPATVLSENGSVLTVAITDAVGSVTSNSATLSVSASAVAPSITSQPLSQTVTVGQTATFNVGATGTSPLAYQWKKNGNTIGGATSASYTTPATTASDSGSSFTVTVSNSKGSLISSAAILTVTSAPAPLSITSQPVSQSVTAGQTATFTVSASGGAPMSYQWNKGGIAIAGANSTSYTTPATTNSDNGASFSVTVSNPAGSVTSNAATLTVAPALAPPSITSQPASQSVTAGQTATFTVTASGAAPMSYQWKKRGIAIAGANSTSYTTPATTNSDNGASYTVTVSNPAGSATSNAATLTVTAAPVAPSITSQPTNQTVNAGQSATFAVSATGTATLMYQWSRNGNAIGGATSASYTTPATSPSDSGAQFSVTVTNGVGSVTSNSATLTVNAATMLLNASATSLDFASVNIGSNRSLGVTFTNAGNSNVTVSSVSISGAGFAASGISTGQILTPGKTATLNLTFTPAGTGSVTGSVTVASDATNSPATVTLSGIGVQPVAHSATLGWSASTSTVAGYNIYRSAVSGGSYAKMNSQLISGTQYPDTTVLAGQTYFYVVTSQDSSGVESGFSNEASAVIPTP